MQVFVTINKDGMKINAGVNAKNWLIKELAIKYLFGILVIMSLNVISHEVFMHEDCKCKRKLVDKLLEECTENNEEVKLAKIISAENENKHK